VAAIKWYWDFGDGSVSFQQNPIHSYQRAGTYTVTMTIWDSDGNTDSEVKINYIVVAETPNMATEDVCLRMSTERSEGIGWSLCSGISWVSPVADWGTFLVHDNNGVQRMLILDDDYETYELDTFDRISVIQQYPLDKEDIDDSEISWERWLPEVTLGPASEHEFIEFDTFHAYLRPLYDANRGAAGYGSTGLRTALEMSLDVYTDGEKITYETTTHDFPENGDVVFSGHKVEARRIQPVLLGTAGELMVTGMIPEFVGKPKVGSRSERTMGEHTLQAEIVSDMTVWVSRGFNKLLDRISQNTLAGSASNAQGPDGRSSSAMNIISQISLANAVIATNYTIIYWYKSGAAIAGTWTQYGATTGGWQLQYRKGAGGIAINQVIPTGLKYDVRIYDKQLSNDAIAYIYRDVTGNEGHGVLPG